MQRITLSVDDDLVATLDRHMKARRYASRSEALRDILREAQARERLEPSADKGDGFCVATLAYVYDHETRDLGRRLTRASIATTISRWRPCMSISTITPASRSRCCAGRSRRSRRWRTTP